MINKINSYEKLRKWYCENCDNHYYESFKNRLENNINCKYCKKLTNSDTIRLKNIKENGTLKDNYPNISKAFHLTGNLPLTSETISHKTNSKYWWICECGVEWYGIIDVKRKGQYTCKHCGYLKTASQNKLNGLKKNDNINISHPEIAKEFNGELNLKNFNLTTHHIHSGTQQKIWWNCDNCNQNYLASPYRRIKDNSGCSKQECINARISLKALERASIVNGGILKTHPAIAIEWDHEKNIIDINKISYGSNKKVWWLCQNCHYSWKTIVKNRIKQNSGCPNCSGHLIISGLNDFQSHHGNLMKYYIRTINSKLKPDQGKVNSHVEALWTCENNHEMIKSFGEMHVNSGCRYCSESTTQKNFTMALKELLFEIFEGEFEVVTGNRDIISPKELDVVIPELKVAIEYNGDY